jgi:hypothetical protein
LGCRLPGSSCCSFIRPGEGKDIYLDLQDQVTRMLTVHIGMLFFIPLMAVVVYVLLRGVEGTAALVSRIALAPYVILGPGKRCTGSALASSLTP